MIIWSGRGLFPLLIFLVCLFVSISIVPKEHANFGFAISFTISGLFSWFFGKKWNSAQRILKDEETGQRIVLKNRHTLFWIPMQYIAYVFILVGIANFFHTSTLSGLISLVIPMILVYKDFFAVNQSRFIVMDRKENKAKPFKEKEKVQELSEEKEAERIRIKKEKEDPSRFMPKF